MLNSIYKFLPQRLEFFDNFLLRASNKYALNDPFEVRPSFDLLADICLLTNCDRFGTTKEEIIEYLKEQPEDSIWSELGISLFKDYGIISFNEEKDNLLMWSHYADQHKGIVIEFDKNHNFFNSQYKDIANPILGKLNRVLYRKLRLDKINDYLMEPYFHKSDEWQYEKEHRLLLSLYHGDTNLIPKENIDHYKSQKYITEKDTSSFTNTLLQVNHYNGSSIIKEPTFMVMFKVPADAIISVTFGAKADTDFIEKVESKLNCPLLKHIKIYEAKIDSYDYRLRFIERSRYHLSKQPT